MQRSRVNNLARSILIIIPMRYSLPNFEITIWFVRYGKPKYMNPSPPPPLPLSHSKRRVSNFSRACHPEGRERRSSAFQHQSSIIYEKRKFLAWIQAKTIHQSINPQSRVELAENISVPIFWLEPSSSFSVCRRKRKKKKLDSVTRHCELTKRASANGDYDSALYIGAVPKRDVILNCVHKEIFHDVFSSSIHSSRVDETRRQSEETKERREVISSLFHSFYFRSWRGKGTGRRSDRWCFKSLKTQRSLNQFEHSHRFFSCFVYFLFWETEFISKHGKIFTFIL